MSRGKRPPEDVNEQSGSPSAAAASNFSNGASSKRIRRDVILSGSTSSSNGSQSIIKKDEDDQDMEEDGENVESEVDEMEDLQGEDEGGNEEVDQLDPEDYAGGDEYHDGGIGVIEKVSITNFMCHNRLEVNFCPKLNFVVGHNGSGKSAILTAITIALGGKAAATNRGNSLKHFVKNEKKTATVQITLRNTGSDAYKPQIFPGKIIVERIITSSGSATWRIKDKDGKLVSQKREDLDSICDHANIQVDNPMNILTQDASRQFLSSAHADEKYQFFLRGTQLAQLAQEYDVIQHNIQLITTVIEHKRKGLPLLRQRAKDKNDLLEIVRKAADQRKIVELLRKQMVWSVVQVSEDKCEAIFTRVEGIKIKVEQASKMRDKAIERRKMHEDEITKIERERGENDNRSNPLVDRIKELKEEEKGFFSKIREAKEEERDLNEQFKRFKAQIDDIDRRIEAENGRMRGADKEKRAALLRQQRQAEMEKKKLETEETEAQDRLRELEGNEIARKDSEIRGLDGKIEHLRNSVGSAEAIMKQIEFAKTNSMAAFGPNIPHLLQLIDRERRWRQKPVGPIGSLIKLRDPRWAPVLESVIGNTLTAFCVTNHHDRNLLLDLKSKARCNEVPILSGADEAFDYSMGEPDKSVLTILRVLDIQSEYVKRQLINSVHIEQSALVSARAEGDILMRRRLRNVKTCFSMDMYRLGGGGGMGSSTMTLQPHKGAPRLSVDLDARIASLRMTHEQEQEQLSQLTNERNRFRHEKAEMEEERRKIKSAKIPNLRRKAREKHAEVDRIGEELHEEEPTNIHALSEAKGEMIQEQEKIPNKLQKVHEIIEENEVKMQPLVGERLKVKTQLEQIRKNELNIHPKLEAAAKARMKAHVEAEHYDGEISKLIAKQDDLEASAAVSEREVVRQTEQAKEMYADRVETDREPQYYEKQIDSAERQLAQAARQHGIESVESITAQVATLFEAFEKARQEIEGLENTIKDLHDAIMKRLSKWRQFRRIIAIRAKDAFAQYLSKRGYSGNLTFDHNKGSLRLTVRTDEASSGHQEKDPKSLSGGEKSFATICLLLALWESIGCPIRCLDEFDVFMDAVNRRISMAMMTEAARSAGNVQYVLITPLGINNVALGPDVRVIKLQDPERGQTTLTQGGAE